MKIFTSLFFLFIILSSCNNDEAGPPLLRVENVDAIDFDEVVVGEVSFGALAAGETSEYEVFDEVYRYNFIRVVFNNGSCMLQPIDFVGETAYTSGKFRYEIKSVVIPQFEDCFVELDFIKE